MNKMKKGAKMRLKDKVIIVVGATGGIGSVLSREFHREGATVVLAARTEENLVKLQHSLGEERTVILPVDATDVVGVSAVFEGLPQRLGLSIDGVVISAGTWARLDKDDWPTKAKTLAEEHFQSIFLPSFVVGFIAQQFFRRQGHGLIVSISSHAAVRPELEGNLTYGPMKAGVWQFMSELMHEIKEPAVRIVDLKPAIVNTPDNAKSLDTPEKRAKAVQPEAIAEWIIDNFDNSNIPAEKPFPAKFDL